jgi:hypothetical protein
MTKLRYFENYSDWLAFLKERGGVCNAKTRSGTACKRRDLYFSGRCKLHGGLSTGPTTSGGKKRSAQNGIQGGRPKKQSP